MQHARTHAAAKGAARGIPLLRGGLPETSQTYRTHRTVVEGEAEAEEEAEPKAEATWKLGQLSTPLEQASVRPRATTMTPVTPRRN